MKEILLNGLSTNNNDEKNSIGTNSYIVFTGLKEDYC